MRNFSTLNFRLYYKALYCLLPRKKLSIPLALLKSRNIILYFDYEREFGGHKVEVGDNDIKHLLGKLSELSIKSTWFTVGKIFEKYPDSVQGVIAGGHEIASHSYGHLPPVQMKRKDMMRDFEQTRASSPVSIVGFHSPKGRWSIRLLSCLRDFGYKYDMILTPGYFRYRPFVHLVPHNNRVIRLQTAGDDWKLFGGNNSILEVFSHFRKLADRINTGEIGGIGIHPWVLVSDRRILNGFELFLQYLSNQEDIYLDTAGNIAARLLQQSGK